MADEYDVIIVGSGAGGAPWHIASRPRESVC